jgi:hypothetical protein
LSEAGPKSSHAADAYKRFPVRGTIKTAIRPNIPTRAQQFDKTCPVDTVCLILWIVQKNPMDKCHRLIVTRHTGLNILGGWFFDTAQEQ